MLLFHIRRRITIQILLFLTLLPTRQDGYQTRYNPGGLPYEIVSRRRQVYFAGCKLQDEITC